MPELTDHELLADFARSDSEEAFAALIARYLNLVYSTALRFTGNSHHAEEIAQAVFIILARKAAGLSPRVVLSGWLYQTTRLTAANFVKGELRRQRREQEAYMQSTLNEPDTTAWEQIAPLLDDAMGRLREKDRDAVVLRFFENKSAAQAAAALHLSEAAIHKRTSRALDKLREFLSKRGVNSTTAIIGGAISVHSMQTAPAALTKAITAAALTKGVAASASILTIVKGSLKIMAWKKTTSTVVIGAIAILIATSAAVVAIKLKPLHHIKPTSSDALSPTMINVLMSIEPNGDVHFDATVDETNYATHPIRTDHFDMAGEDLRFTDESGHPVKFIKEGAEGYNLTLNRAVPPGGRVSYNVEGQVSAQAIKAAGIIKSGNPGEFSLGLTNYPGNDGEMRYIHTWRLPVGAILLDKDGEMEQTTNDGQVEVRIDKTIPPGAPVSMAFRYRTAAGN